jgi:Skp family chaperone for outer membrane proteins
VWQARLDAATVRGPFDPAMKLIPSAVLFVASVLCPAAWASAQAQEPASTEAKASPSPKIGVVDFVKVVEAYPRAIEERSKIEEMRKQQRAALEAELKKGRELEMKLEDLQRGTPAHDMKLHELRLKKQDIEGLEQIFDRDWRRKIDEFYNAIYGDLERAVAIVAKERGVHIVLRAHPQLEGESTENRARVFEARMVWFASPEIDLTPFVIKLLQVPLPAEPKAENAKPVVETKPGKSGEPR